MRVFWFGLVLTTMAMALEPTTTLKDGQVLQLNGVAQAERLRVPMYIAALYVSVPSSQPKELEAVGAAQMQFRFLQRLSARQWSWYITEQITINSPESLWKEKVPVIQAFANLFQGALRPGDLLKLTYKTGEGMRVTLDDVELGVIKDETIFPLLLHTWIGPRPPSERFKGGILSYQKNPELEDKFSKIVFAPERQGVIRRWALRAQLAAQDQQKSPSETRAAPGERTKDLQAQDRTGREKAPKASTQTTEGQSVTAKSSNQGTINKSVKKETTKQVAQAKKQPSKGQPSEGTKLKKVKRPEPTSTTAKVDKKGEHTKKVAEQSKPRPPALTPEQRLALLEGYQESVIDLVLEKKSYPYQAMKRRYKRRSALDNKHVTAVFRVTIRRDGQLKSVELVTSSGEKILDRAAERLIRDTQPYPPFPSRLPDDTVTFEISVPYTIR